MNFTLLIHRTVFLMVLAVTAIHFTVLPSNAASQDAKAASGRGKKKLLLFAKNPSDWAIVKNGASGKLVYHEASGNFSLNAVGLHPRSPYALVRYADAPPNGHILARGVSDERGRLELTGVWKNWSKKFWVVAGEDVVGNAGEAGTLKVWRPDRYLFEEKQLGIECNCPEPEEP
jgi:hypothetical protein